MVYEEKEVYINRLFKSQQLGMDLIRSLMDNESYDESILRELQRNQFNLELIIKIFFYDEVGYDLHWIIPRLLEKIYIYDLLNILHHAYIGKVWQIKIIKYIMEEGDVYELKELTKINMSERYKNQVEAKYILLLLGEQNDKK